VIKNNKKNIFDYLIVALCAILILIKYNTLSLPYFWDEAWPYATGVHLMYDKGISLLPGAIPFEISRGHPLFFHFLSSLGMKIFGNSIFISHCFSLFISCCLIVTIYFFGEKFFSAEAGFFSALIICVQPVFLAQSSMLLPEMLLALLSFLSLYFYLTGKKIFFVLSSVFLLLTKESGIVILLSILLKEFFDSFSTKPAPSLKPVANKFLLLLSPMLLASFFFVIQKIKTGNFFLPLYISHENFELKNILDKLSGYSAFLFIYQGRNLLSAILVLSFIFLFIRRKEIALDKKEIGIIYLLTIFIVVFLFFSASSFYSPRYLLSILPAFILITTYFLFLLFKK